MNDGDVYTWWWLYDDFSEFWWWYVIVWAWIMLLNYEFVDVDNSSGGELLSLGQCMFYFLSGGDFKHHVFVALPCCDMHSLHRCCWWKRQVIIQARRIGDLSRIRAGWIRGSSRNNLEFLGGRVPQYKSCICLEVTN